MIPGLLGALLAATLYGAATVLQAVGVRRAGGARTSGRWDQAWAGRVYAVGLALDGLGFLASIAALRTLPLFVVQSAIASSVAVTAVLAVLFLGVRLSRTEIGALLGVGLGLGALAVSSGEGRAVPLPATAPWLLLGAVLPVVAIGVVAHHRGGSDGATLLAVTAGLGFGGVGVAARVAVDPSSPWRVLLDPVAWALVGFGAIGVVAYGLALGRGSVTTTAAITFVVETIVPAAIGILWLGDRARDGLAPVAALGFVLTLGGSVLLARHSADEVPVSA